MIKPCIRCKNQKDDKDLRDIRGNEEAEGYIIARFPEVLQIPENTPIDVCVNCLRELTAGNNNVHGFSQSLPKSRNFSSIRDSEDVVGSQSIGSAPFSSSVDKNVNERASLDLEKLRKPGEIEKLVANNVNVQKNMRDLLSKPMPAAAKKRKLQEMLDNNLPNERDGQRSSSNSQSQTVIEVPKSLPNYRQQFFESYAYRPNRLQRSYRSNPTSFNNSNHSTSIPSSNSQNGPLTVSSEAIIAPSLEITVPPASPVIRNIEEIQALSQQALSQPALVPLYDNDSDSDRVRNASLNSSIESGQGSLRRSSRNSSRRPSTSSVSDDGQQVRRGTDRTAQTRQNDGVDHSNLAAPRRVNLNVPMPTSSRPNSKVINGG